MRIHRRAVFRISPSSSLSLSLSQPPPQIHASGVGLERAAPFEYITEASLYLVGSAIACILALSLSLFLDKSLCRCPFDHETRLYIGYR